MRTSHIIAIVAAVLVFGGFFYFYHYGGLPKWPTPAGQTPPKEEESVSTATNYDECIAEGNKPLPDAPDKCLTSNGHIFIQGVVETEQ